jgi:hypothetical protein
MIPLTVLWFTSKRHPSRRRSNGDHHNPESEQHHPILLRIGQLQRRGSQRRHHGELQRCYSQRPYPVQFDGRPTARKRGSILSWGQRCSPPSGLRRRDGLTWQLAHRAKPSIPAEHKHEYVGVSELYHWRVNTAHERYSRSRATDYCPVQFAQFLHFLAAWGDFMTISLWAG